MGSQVWRVRLRYRHGPDVALQERLTQARWIEEVLDRRSRVLVYTAGLSVLGQVSVASVRPVVASGGG